MIKGILLSIMSNFLSTAQSIIGQALTGNKVLIYIGFKAGNVRVMTLVAIATISGHSYHR